MSCIADSNISGESFLSVKINTNLIMVMTGGLNMANNNNYTDYGKDRNFEKPPKRKINWLRIALMMILIGGILAGGAWLAGGRGGMFRWTQGLVFFTDPIGGDETHNVTVSTQNINELQILASSARVHLRTNHRGNDIEITFVGMSPNYTASGGRLTVDARRDNIITGIHIFGGTIGTNDSVHVYIPVGIELGASVSGSSGRVDVRYPYFSELNIRTSSGRIELEHAEVSGSLTLSSSSGRISAEYVTAPSGSFQSSSGRIEISDSHFGNLYVSSSSGRQEIEDSSWNNLQASSSSGRIEINDAVIPSAAGITSISASSGRVDLTVIGNESDFNYSLRSNSGSVRVDGERRQSRNIENLHDINIRTTSGAIRLNFD